MRLVSVVLILVAAVLAIGTANAPNGKPHYDLKDAPALFEKFIKDYNRHYKDQEDYNIHYNAFVGNLKEINRLNAIDVRPWDTTFGINKFADYTAAEQENLFGGGGGIPKHVKNVHLE